MKNTSLGQQQGAVLIIALVMLLVLTLLATTSIRGTALDSRITGNRVDSLQLQHMAEAALREAEFRMINYRAESDILEYDASNCSLDNKLSRFNRPCLLKNVTTQEKLNDLFKEPIKFLNKDANKNDDGLTWMPYRGLVMNETYTPEEGEPEGYWNVHLVEPPSPEYANNTGIAFFLATGQANEQVAVQSTFAVLTLGDL